MVTYSFPVRGSLTRNEKTPGTEARATKAGDRVHLRAWDGRLCPSSSGAGRARRLPGEPPLPKVTTEDENPPEPQAKVPPLEKGGLGGIFR
jgi:hypothetical protein